jgi:hypothetical protein
MHRGVYEQVGRRVAPGRRHDMLKAFRIRQAFLLAPPAIDAKVEAGLETDCSWSFEPVGLPPR